jgi:ketosteroid isomerase-like protein
VGQLNAYRDAFNERDSKKLLALFSEHAIFEMPLLGQRLFGKREIAVGLRRIFEVTEFARLEFSNAKLAPKVLIAEGRMHAKLHRDAQAVEIPLAVVIEADASGFARLSTYLDARPYRLWADAPLFAAADC